MSKKSHKKKVVIDITHASHVNMFKYVIPKIASQYDVYVVALYRGSIKSIIEKEIDMTNVISFKMIGKWFPNKLGIILNANLFRFISLFFYFLKLSPSIGVSSGSIPFSLALKMNLIPSIDFSDDPERKFVSNLEILLCSKKFYPFNCNMYSSKKIGSYNCLKQWGYLSPQYFSPNVDSLREYNLNPKEYIFIREVSTSSLNYSDQSAGLISSIARQLPENYTYILSLENKKTASSYPSNWIILKEPIVNIHSLIYYSKLLVSSGDSMAREGAILGVPSIYCGIREMEANKIMISNGSLFKVDVFDVPKFVDYLLDIKDNSNNQENFRKHLDNSWDDLNTFIAKQIDLNIKN